MVAIALPSAAGAGREPGAVPAAGPDGGRGHAFESWVDPVPGIGAQSTGVARFGVLAADVAALDAALATLSGQGVAPLRVWRTSLIGFVADLTFEQADALRAQPGVTSVEHERPVQSAIEQLEPVWNLDRLDQISTMPDLYYSSEKTGAGVPIYVFDSGLNITTRNGQLITHADFLGRVPDYAYPEDGFADGCNGIRDCNGHGTHVAGTAAGTTYGVAKGAQIIPIKVFGRSRVTTTLQVANAIYFVLDVMHVPGTPAVANFSLGGPPSDVLDAAIEEMIQAGFVVAIAAGNEGEDACFTSPARVPDALTVGAVNRYDLEAGFSNWGLCLDIYAPGVEIVSASHLSSTGAVLMDGTSMAAPHVAGAAALELEGRGPGTQWLEVWNAIAGRSLPGVVDFVHAGPSTNLLLQVQREVIPRKTLQLERTGGGKGKVTFTEPQGVCGIPCVARLPQGTPAAVSAVASPGSYFTGWSGNCQANGAVCTLSVDDDTILTANFIVPARPGAPTSVAVTPGNRTLGVTWSPPTDSGGAPVTGYQYSTGSTWRSVPSGASTFTITGLSNGRTYQVRLRAVTMAGAGAASTVVVGTPRTVPSAPSITSVTPGNGQLTVKFSAPSTNGAPISAYEYSIDNGATFTTVGAPPSTRTIVIGGLTNGTAYQVRVRAVNAAGAGAPSRARAGTPRTVPGAPSIDAVVAGSRSLTLTITAPTSTGGSPITSYQYSLDGGTRWSTKSLTAGSMKLTSLRAGTTYNVIVRAVNAAGAGAASAPGSGTPTSCARARRPGA